jgi:cyclopropane-fatty-acyl-phospholipid synthase
MTPIAPTLAALVTDLVGVDLPIRLRAWDGSEAGPADAPVAVLRARRALRRLLWDPSELGLARAFVAGDLAVEGDLTDGLRRCWQLAARTGAGIRLSGRDRLRAARTLARLGVLGPRPRPPAAEARLSGRLHTKLRDRAAIAHHYDLSNDFYRLLLDDRVVYSCAYWTADGPGYTLEDAQRDKLDAICRRLGLGPGMRLLDIGCGWGALVHAAREYGVHATGVTLSREQRDFGRARVAELGLAGQVEIRLRDYREIAEAPFDAVSSIEMGEHVGEGNYPTYAATLHRLVRPHGRVLLQQMSRGDVAPGGGAFIERYVAPDMHMRPLGATIGLLERAGLEVVDMHALREHYVWTVRPWLDRLTAWRDEVVALVGAEQYRVWQLYLAGGALSFEQGRMGVHQVLMVRPDESGATGLPRSRPAILGADPAERRDAVRTP